jgi:hypothetical protein
MLDDQAETLRIVISRLESAGFPYMLVGSTAANFYAHPRMTRDIDIVIELEPEDAARMAELFSDAFYCDVDAVRRAISTRRMFNLVHLSYIVKVDFVVRKADEYERVAFSRRTRVQAGEGQQIWIIAPEDLVLSKLRWARQAESEQQMRDVRLVVASVPELDWAYLERWAPAVGVADLLAEVRKHGLAEG